MEVKALLEREDIYYQERGADLLVRCLNPEHDDSNPSMRIDAITGVFNCFSCAFKGSIFTLYGETPNYLQQKRLRMKDKIEHVRASSIGLEMPKGFMPYEGDWRGISPDTYRRFNAFTHHDSDFAGRIWFPLTDMTGRAVVFQGRLLEQGSPKYKNYPKKVQLPMMMCDDPRQGTVILVEGIFDLLNLYDKGLKNVVPIFGVNKFNDARADLLKLRGVSKVFTFLDGDDAGQEGVEKLTKVLDRSEILHQNILFKGRDPGELSLASVQKLEKHLYG